MNTDTDGPDRTCMRLRRVVEADDAGLNHAVHRYCRNLLGLKQMYCDRCESEMAHEREGAMSMEIQR